MLKMIKLNLRSLRYQHMRRWVWWFRQMIHSCLIKRLEALRKGRGTSYIWKLSEGRETRGEEKWYSTWWHGSKERTGHTSLSCSRNHWKWRYSIFRELSKCFTNNYYDEWSGFYSQGYPASSQHRHMSWHVKYKKTSGPHKDHWYTDSDKQLMEAYIARHKDEYPLSLLEDLRKEAVYGCSDPRLHLRARAQADRSTEEAEEHS